MKRVSCCLLMVLALLQAPLRAAELPAYYPAFFAHSGTVNQINPVLRSVVVNDAMFRLSDTVRFHTPQAEFDALSRLRAGDQVGVRYVRDGNNQWLVTDIWLLPVGTPLLR